MNTSSSIQALANPFCIKVYNEDNITKPTNDKKQQNKKI